MGTAQGVLRGCGRQTLLMAYNLVGFWVCGVLLGALLCFKAGLGMQGLWIGIASGDTITGGSELMHSMD
jgi:MATE family multidrug resistance protein